MNAVGGEFAHSLGEVLHALTGRFKFQIIAIVEVIFQVGMVAPRNGNAVTKGVVHAAREVDDEAKEVGREGFHLSACSDIGFVDAALAVHETDAVDAQFGVKRHGDAERTAPFIEVHRGQVKRYVGFHAGALVGITQHATVFVRDLVFPIVRIETRQREVQRTRCFK